MRRLRLPVVAAGVAALLVVLAGSQPPAGAVVGGRPAHPKRWGFTVALRNNDRGNPKHGNKQFFCSGSLIAPQLVLTAGHCIRHKGFRKLSVVVNRARLRAGKTGQVIKVSEVRRFPTYSKNEHHDVSLVFLAKPADAQPIQLATAAQANRLTRPGSKLFIAGYGDTHPLFSEEPRYGHLTVGVERTRPARRCRYVYGRQTFHDQSMICSLGRTFGPKGIGSTTCSGDSGGPLVAWTGHGFLQVGVTSYGNGFGNIDCGARAAPSVYGRASWGMSFIAKPLSEALATVPAG